MLMVFITRVYNSEKEAQMGTSFEKKGFTLDSVGIIIVIIRSYSTIYKKNLLQFLLYNSFIKMNKSSFYVQYAHFVANVMSREGRMTPELDYFFLSKVGIRIRI